MSRWNEGEALGEVITARPLPLAAFSSLNRGSSSFLHTGQRSVEVQCLPLLDVLRQQDIERVDAAKLDVEGFGLRVLRPYLSRCTPEQRPRLVVIEKEDGVNDLLVQAGYLPVYESAMNMTYRRRETARIPR